MVLANRWPDGERFKAVDIANQINDRVADADAEKSIMAVREYMFPRAKADEKITVKAIGKRLRDRVGNPARYEQKTMILRSERDTNTKTNSFWVELREP
jgi:hypothetical protein